MSSTTSAPRHRGRRAPQEGPRASFKQLLPFLFEHRSVLVVVAVLSVLSAVAMLAQPLLVGVLIGRVEASEPLGWLVWGIVALVIIASLISGYQHYLLQRTGTAVVYSSRRKLIGRILHLPISEFDARRTGDLVSRVGTDTTLLYAVLTQGLVDAIGNALIFVGALVATLRTPRAPMLSAAFTADGKRLLTTHDDAEARIWLVPEGTLLANYRDDRLRAAVPSGDGRTIITGSDFGRPPSAGTIAGNPAPAGSAAP